MRILSVGRPLAHREIDNHTIFNAPAFSDYEAVVVDPGGVFEAVRQVVDGTAEHRTYSATLVTNGQGSTDSVSAADVLRRRRDETARLLERGGVMVVFGYPQATMPQVLGFTGADRYAFLPAPSGLAWAPPLLQWGEGSAIAITDHAHPFASFIDAIRADVRYRAVFDEHAPRFAEEASVFARSGGGAPLGVEFAVHGGHVVFLPTPGSSGGEAGMAQGAAIEAAVRELLGRPDPDELEPYWLQDAAVPGLAPLLETATSARDLAARAEERATAAEREAAALTRLRDVLWREGRYGLLPAVLRCCELLGFRPWETDAAFTLQSDEGTLLLEAEGAREEVGMAPHYRLRARLDALLTAEGSSARGLIVVNGQRLERPEARRAPYLDALRVAAEATGYAVLPAPELFAAARAAMAGAEPSQLAALRQRLMETDGVVSFADLLGEGGSGLGTQ